MTTRATAKPLRRVVNGMRAGELTVEIRDTEVTLRPFHSRRGGAGEVTVTWLTIYTDAILRRDLKPRRRRRLVIP